MEHLKGDKEAFLLIAKHFIICKHHYEVARSLKLALPALTSDKDFMLQLIELNPNIYHAASNELRKDFEVLLVAFGNAQGKFPVATRGNWSGRTLANFISRVKLELRHYEIFVGTVLFGMTRQPEIALDLLNQGEPTAVNYKRLIVAFVDVPTGKRLHLLRTATANLVSVLEAVARFP